MVLTPKQYRDLYPFERGEYASKLSFSEEGDLVRLLSKEGKSKWLAGEAVHRAKIVHFLDNKMFGMENKIEKLMKSLKFWLAAAVVGVVGWIILACYWIF